MEQKTNEGWEKRYSNLLTPGTRIMAPTAQEAMSTHNTREGIEEIIEEKIKGYYEDIEQHERTKEAIKNKEVVYLGEFGNVLCEDDYLAWEEWVDSVAIGGSSREKFIKLNLNRHQELQKARESERERILTEIDRLGNFWTNNGAWKIPTDQEMADDSFKALKFGKVEILSDLKKFIQSELDQPTEINIELPDVSNTGGKAKPRIHMAPGDSSCISCEG